MHDAEGRPTSGSISSTHLLQGFMASEPGKKPYELKPDSKDPAVAKEFWRLYNQVREFDDLRLPRLTEYKKNPGAHLIRISPGI